MTKGLLATTTAAAVIYASGILAQDVTTFVVTDPGDTGPGTLRDALSLAAAAGTKSRILLTTYGPIAIEETLIYDGTAPLEIVGDGQMIVTDANVTLLAVPNGADLNVSDLSFSGHSGFDIENRGDLEGPAGKGIFVGVPADATADVRLRLTNVTVADVAGHGVHMSDCSLADDCGAGAGGGGDGSAAGLDITLSHVTIDNVGHGRFDADGFRADERGEGNITFRATGSTFSRVGADGVELDEGDAGSIIGLVKQSFFLGNGNYCDPAVLAGFLPDPDEAAFEDGVTSENSIPGPVTAAPDNACIEREVELYESGFVEEYGFGLDLDDGIDLDEAGDGSLDMTMWQVTVTGNLDEGIDFDEAGAGDITVNFIDVVASGNTDDGFKMSEEDDGSIFGLVAESTASTNGGKGVVFEEEGAGDVDVQLHHSATNNNDDRDDTGLEVVQEDDGVGTVVLAGSTIADGIDADGVTLAD